MPFRRMLLQGIQPLAQGIGEAIPVVDPKALLQAIQIAFNLELVRAKVLL